MVKIAATRNSVENYTLTNDNLKLVVDPNFYVDSLKVTE
jgi:hypothetical protein